MSRCRRTRLAFKPLEGGGVRSAQLSSLQLLAEVEATKLLPNDRKELADDGWAGIVGVELEATAAAAYQRPKASAGSLSSSRSSSESTAQATTDGRGERALRVKSRFPKV